MNNKSKKFMIFSVLTLIIVVIVSSTYAWYVWTTDEDDIIKIVTKVGAGVEVAFYGGSNISANLRPVSSMTKGIVKEISIKADTSSLTFNLYLDINSIDEDLKHSSFKYALYNNSGSLKTSGNFASYTAEECTKNSTSHIVLLEEEPINTTKTTYKLYIWIDGTEGANPSTMMNKTFSFNLHADGQDAVLKEGKTPNITTYPENQKQTLAYKILSDYYYAEKLDISNGGVRYHYDTTHSLMADIGSNVRYYGASPNNYIYFNCSDYSNQNDTTCEKWRIIGVFNGKVKIIRNESIGSYSWDSKSSGVGTSASPYGSNDWSDSRLMIMLNPTDYSSSFSTNIYAYDKGSYWYGLNSTCYAGSSSKTTSCNFTSIGLRNDTTRNLISEETYYLRGYNSVSVYSDEMYNYERTMGSVYNTSRTTSWTGKIALAYLSDYGYAADFNQCNQTLSKYYDSTCTGNNWLKNILGTSRYSWSLVPDSSKTNYAWIVDSSGNVTWYYGDNTSNTRGVAPVLHLNSNIELASNTGNGTSTTPYKLSIGS